MAISPDPKRPREDCNRRVRFYFKYEFRRNNSKMFTWLEPSREDRGGLLISIQLSFQFNFFQSIKQIIQSSFTRRLSLKRQIYSNNNINQIADNTVLSRHWFRSANLVLFRRNLEHALFHFQIWNSCVLKGKQTLSRGNSLSWYFYDIIFI